MTRRSKVAVVLLGYLAAFVVAGIAVAVYGATTDTPDRQASSGMSAFGDFVVFLGILGLASLPATGAALFFLRGNKRFWMVSSALALALAATGIAPAIAHLTRYDGSHPWLQSLALFSPLRVLAAPLLALAFFLSALLAPARSPRTALLIAAVVEAAVFVTVAFQWLRGVH